MYSSVSFRSITLSDFVFFGEEDGEEKFVSLFAVP
jgi:hypothetical protein